LNRHIDKIPQIVQDPDTGSKPIGLQTLLLIADTYGRSGGLDLSVINAWTSLLANELLDPRPEIVSPTIPVITQLIQSFGTITPKNAGRAIQAFYDRITPESISDVLSLLSVLIPVEAIASASEIDIGSHVLIQKVDHLVSILLKILKTQSVQVQALGVVSILYQHTTPRPEDLSSLSKLNSSVIEIASIPSDRQLAALNTLGVFISKFGIVDTSERALSAIASALALSSAAKNACTAIGLIGSSPHSSILLPLSSQIADQLLPSQFPLGTQKRVLKG
jgi:hypothetical protein